MGISYEDVLKYHKTMKGKYTNLLIDLENDILNERDTNRIPIYSTVRRVKHADSIYLKTKRKAYNSLEDIYDLAGLRVLCLFEVNIPEIHGLLLRIFSDKKGAIKEMTGYNWKREDDGNIVDLIESYTKAAGLKIDLDPVLKRKESGYKSIHYIVEIPHGGINLFIEVQLRTILQDAWAELEHTLSYKQGTIHPHIKKSFQLLARDLQTNDNLISHLKDISKKEKVGVRHSILKAGPNKWMGYENNLLPAAFTTKIKKDQYEAYVKHIAGVAPSEQHKEWIDETRRLFEDLTSDLLRGKAKEKEKVRYFCEMEEAWLKFCDRQYPEALNSYQKLLLDYENQYVIYFRIGELHFILDEIEKALASFDKSEILLSGLGEFNAVNRYRIKVKLANIYWMLGNEYSEISLREIREAETIFKTSLRLSPPDLKYTIMNNVCWYQLEQYLKSKGEEDYKLLKKEYFKLAKILNGKGISSNSFDTAAYCCYNFYLKERKKDWLDKAIKYCDMMDERLNRATFMFASYNLHINHLKEILDAKAVIDL